MAYQTDAAWKVWHGSDGMREAKVIAGRDTIYASIKLDSLIMMKMKPDQINKRFDDLIEAINCARAWVIEGVGK